ncbi:MULTISPECIES: carbohydrate ABC transporter permease [Pasteurellaceae]|uniref:Carbohydrate ABC transporter permease n=1 Tax=Pasteurella atlantica TaxID=2827233 RepID=A0AAW8CT70_9PAST|nr:carbohydrate ABC transporter permease [Pasteurella atlantica]MBR0574652.1 carbohydrate ABC transporter permease [Pasteurella atlantica]MDP8040564.1 carbohydrate ABC transporter permease [Pasteurella atlantica]MDP8042697.1 carbohydrate ABC transporter permease [Pasteurella atlantica]MDP8044782.1 carbohydrate ABC transporter permease [Pasteurella atlantica]MDP8046879.1 carbohydrate ABC transporter permease [Pasteurella atlantica]
MKNSGSLSKSTKMIIYLYMAFTCLISLFPIGWIFLSSLKADPMMNPGLSLPTEISIEGYINVFTELGVHKYFWNSFKIVSISVILSIIMISMSSYVIARMEFRGKKLVTAMLYSTLFIPATAMTFPIYRLVGVLGIFNTPIALIFVYTCSGIAMSFFIIKNYFMIIPKELEEAAEIDGASHTQIFWKIMLPIARPGILTAAILAFINNWNEYYWASMLIIDKAQLTVPALLGQFTTSFNTNYNGLFSAIFVIVLPPIILFAFTSKYFIEALGGGAVKG